MSLPHIAVHS